MAMKNPPHPGDLSARKSFSPQVSIVTAATAALKICRPSCPVSSNGKAAFSGKRVWLA
jgi:hypothetical protein